MSRICFRTATFTKDYTMCKIDITFIRKVGVLVLEAHVYITLSIRVSLFALLSIGFFYSCCLFFLFIYSVHCTYLSPLYRSLLGYRTDSRPTNTGSSRQYGCTARRQQNCNNRSDSTKIILISQQQIKNIFLYNQTNRFKTEHFRK